MLIIAWPAPINTFDFCHKDQDFDYLYYLAGRLTGDTATAARGADEAESAYLALWRAAARGKKKRGDQW